MTDEPKAGKLPTSPKVQDASAVLMQLRAYCDEVEEAALHTITAIRKAGDELMGLSSTMMRADYGEIEARLYRLAAVGGEARAIHKLASEIVRRVGMTLPANLPYGDYELPETVSVKLRTVRRR
jgi:hypothetical protein